MSEISEAVSTAAQPAPRSALLGDTATLTLRVFTLACAAGGITTTLGGLQDAFASGVALRYAQMNYQLWSVVPYLLLVAIAMLRVSRRSLATLLVTTLLAWFMSTGYGNLDQMELAIGVIPLIQLAFIGGALMVMFTFWLLRQGTR